MTIQDIMLRDIQDAKRKQSERAERAETTWGDECGFPWLAVAVWLAVALAALGAAFTGGMWFQAERTRKADCADAAWCDRAEREATERARAMSNYELLNATGRECADTANR